MRSRGIYIAMAVVVFVGLGVVYAVGVACCPPEDVRVPVEIRGDRDLWSFHVLEWLMLYDTGQYEAAGQLLEGWIDKQKELPPEARRSAELVAARLQRHIDAREEEREEALRSLAKAEGRMQAGEYAAARDLLRSVERRSELLEEAERHLLAGALRRAEEGERRRQRELLGRYERGVRMMAAGDSAAGVRTLDLLRAELGPSDEVLASRVAELVESTGTTSEPASPREKPEERLLRQALAQIEKQEYQSARSALERLTQSPGQLTAEQRRLVTASLARIAELTRPVPRKLEMVRVPGGDFMMGATDMSDAERPPHLVTLRPFLVGRYEVTNEQYKEFLDALKEEGNPRKFAHPDQPAGWDHTPISSAPEAASCAWRKGMYPPGAARRPVVLVAWFDAYAYAKWRGLRLPTEAEWEQAARGLEGRMYPWGDHFRPGLCNSYEDAPYRTSEVGSYPRGVSPWNVHDMAGNVWEWCADRYEAGYYAESARNDPQGPQSGKQRVLRGGSWSTSQEGVRSAKRYALDPAERRVNVGFRVAGDVEQE